MKEPRSSTEIIISALYIIARGLEFTESAAVCEAAGRLEELSQECEKLRQERDELAAHIYHIEAAEEISYPSDDCAWAGDYINQLRAAIMESPKVCLAEVRAQAIELFAEQWDFERGGDGEFAVFACKYADRIRKEAK